MLFRFVQTNDVILNYFDIAVAVVVVVIVICVLYTLHTVSREKEIPSHFENKVVEE